MNYAIINRAMLIALISLGTTYTSDLILTDRDLSNLVIKHMNTRSINALSCCSKNINSTIASTEDYQQRIKDNANLIKLLQNHRNLILSNEQQDIINDAVKRTEWTPGTASYIWSVIAEDFFLPRSMIGYKIDEQDKPYPHLSRESFVADTLPHGLLMLCHPQSEMRQDLERDSVVHRNNMIKADKLEIKKLGLPGNGGFF